MDSESRRNLSKLLQSWLEIHLGFILWKKSRNKVSGIRLGFKGMTKLFEEVKKCNKVRDGQPFESFGHDEKRSVIDTAKELSWSIFVDIDP